MPYTVADIAKILSGNVIGEPSLALRGFAPADQAEAGDLTFAENETYFERAEQSAASAILVDGVFTSKSKTLIRVPNARIAFAKAVAIFLPEPVFPPTIHSTAVVAESAEVDPSAYVGPFCVVSDGANIGPRSVLRGGNYVGSNCKLGEEVRLFPNVVLYAGTEIGNRVRIHAGSVIGADGFGYVFASGAHRKVTQIGHVIIRGDVEIGSNVTIDRGALGPTIIGRGTKIDNLVQIAHNVSLGEHCLVVSQAGIAGSTKLGNYYVLSGQVGLAGHLKIGDRASVAAQSGVMHNIGEGEKWFGYPAKPDRQMKRQLIAIEQLPQLVRRVNELEKLLAMRASSEPIPSPEREV